MLSLGKRWILLIKKFDGTLDVGRGWATLVFRDLREEKNGLIFLMLAIQPGADTIHCLAK